jgi:hypothetical protein
MPGPSLCILFASPSYTCQQLSEIKTNIIAMQKQVSKSNVSTVMMVERDSAETQA